jgi:hypothetical protein
MCRDEIAPVLKTKPVHIDSLLGELPATRKLPPKNRREGRLKPVLIKLALWGATPRPFWQSGPASPVYARAQVEIPVRAGALEYGAAPEIAAKV